MTDYEWHPSGDDLVLHFYGELPDDVRARVSDHLPTCRACKAEHHALVRTLHLAGTLRAPDPSPTFEHVVWQRLQPHLPQQSWALRHVLTVGTWAAAVAVVVAGTWAWTQQTPMGGHGSRAMATPPTASVQERVLLTAVDAHLMQAEMLFVELLNAPVDAPDTFVHARPMADDLVSNGRLYRETARATGDAPVAAVLDDLEAVLVEVARSPERPRVQDVRALQGRITEDGLLFKVRAVAYDVRDRQSRIAAGEGAL